MLFRSETANFVLSGAAFDLPSEYVIKNPTLGHSAELKRPSGVDKKVSYSAVVTEVEGSKTHQLTLTPKAVVPKTPLHDKVAVTKTQEGDAAPVDGDR